MVAVGIEFFPGGHAPFIQVDGLIEVSIAPGIPALLDGAVGGKQNQGIEAPVAVAVDLLAHPHAVLEVCDSVVVSVGAGVAFLENQDAPRKSLAEIEAGVPGGVQFVLSGVAVGIEVAPGVQASVEVPVLLIAGGGVALEMNPVVDPVIAVAVLFEPLGLALGVGDAPGVGDAVAPGIGLHQDRLGAVGSEAEPAVHPAVGVGVLFAPGQAAALVIEHPGLELAVLIAVALHADQFAAPVEFDPVGFAGPGGIHATLLDGALGEVGLALEAAVAVGIHGLEDDAFLGVEAVAGIGFAIGVAVFELLVLEALAVDDSGVELSVFRGVGFFLDDLIRDFGAVEGDPFGLAVAVGVAFVPDPAALGIVAGNVVAPAGVAVDGLALELATRE